jgi:ParB family chromosome partitioning protein
MLAHDLITVRPQVRRSFPEAEQEELRASIREIREQGGGIEGTGVLQALLVSPVHGDEGAVKGYRLIAGERRYRCTKDENITEVPCIVVPEVGESLVRLMQLTENALRTPPPIVEEAIAMRETIDEMQISLRDMARMMGKSLGYVTERLNLLKMKEDVQQMVFARANTLRHARLIDTVEDETLRRELIAAVLDGIGEREIRRRIQTQLEDSQPEESKVEESKQVFARANSETPNSEQSSAIQNRKGITINHDRKTQWPGKGADPLTEHVQPASVFLAEAKRNLQGLDLTDEYKTQLRSAVEVMKEHLAQIAEIAK